MNLLLRGTGVNGPSGPLTCSFSASATR